MGREYIITYGQNRIHTTFAGNTPEAAMKIAELRRLQNEGNAVQYQHYTGSDADSPRFRQVFSEVSRFGQHAQYRMGTDGMPELRPKAWLEVISGDVQYQKGIAYVLGTELTLECLYECTHPESHVVETSNGDRYDLGTNRQFILDKGDVPHLNLTIQSTEEHYPMVFAMTWQESL